MLRSEVVLFRSILCAIESFDFGICVIWGLNVTTHWMTEWFGCSEREYQRGDEIAWYADGDKIVRNEYNPATAYAFGIAFIAFLVWCYCYSFRLIFWSVNQASTGKLTLILLSALKLWMLILEFWFNLWQIEFLDHIQIQTKCMKWQRNLW